MGVMGGMGAMGGYPFAAAGWNPYMIPQPHAVPAGVYPARALPPGAVPALFAPPYLLPTALQHPGGWPQAGLAAAPGSGGAAAGTAAFLRAQLSWLQQTLDALTPPHGATSTSQTPPGQPTTAASSATTAAGTSAVPVSEVGSTAAHAAAPPNRTDRASTPTSACAGAATSPWGCHCCAAGEGLSAPSSPVPSSAAGAATAVPEDTPSDSATPDNADQREMLRRRRLERLGSPRSADGSAGAP